MTKIIEVTVFPSGDTNLETRGFTGSDCRDASHCIEQALGITSQEKLTAEYHQQLPATQELQQHQN
jgi:hypothetical protein